MFFLTLWDDDVSSSPVLLKNGKAFSSDATPRDSGRVDEPFKVEEAEPVKAAPPPPSPDKVIYSAMSAYS